MIRSGGLITGLDTNTLIASLVGIERQPITKLQKKKSGFQSQISLIGGIKSALTDLTKKAKELDTASELVTNTALSTNEDAFTATATGAAAKSSYSLEVTALAKAEKNRSDGFATDAQVNAGTLSLVVQEGDAQDIIIEEGDTLRDVAAKINDQAEGVSASIIDDGTNIYLSITADSTGHTGAVSSSAITITETYTGSGGADMNLIETQTAQNARIKVDGLEIESESNTFKDAVSGLTIKAIELTTEEETLTVEADHEAIEAKLQEFVDAYNKAMDLVLTETKVAANTNRETTLAGDSTIRTIRSAISNAVNYSIDSLDNGKFDALSAIGIKTGADGTLKLDSKKVQEALEADVNNVQKLFTASDGVSARLIDAIDSYTAIDGILANRTDGINDSIKNIDTRVERLEIRVAAYEKRLVSQFTALEISVSSLQEQGNYLASALG